MLLTGVTLLAMGVLFGRLADRGQVLRARLMGSLEGFVGQDVSHRFERMTR